MGASDSRHNFQHGHLYVQLYKTTYNAGETMQGVVHLSLSQQFPTKVLQLEFSGYEKTFWITKERQGRSTVKKKHNGLKKLFSTRTNMFAFPQGTAQPGQYSFPFVFQIPLGCPSTFVFFGEHKSKMAVSYKVRAIMEERCDGTKAQFKPLMYKQKFIVRKIPDVLHPNKKIKLEKNISTFLFVKQGNSKAEVTFEKDVFVSGETARVTCDVDNTACEKDIEKVKVKLRRILNFKDQKNKTFSSNNFLSIAKYPGVKAGEKKLLNLELRITQNFEEIKNYGQLYVHKRKKALTREDNNIINYVLPTTMGEFVKCSYQLEVSFTHKGATLGSKIPSAKLQVLINAPYFELHSAPIPAPQNWNPQVYQPNLMQGGDFSVGMPVQQQIPMGYGAPIMDHQPEAFIQNGHMSARNPITSGQMQMSNGFEEQKRSQDDEKIQAKQAFEQHQNQIQKQEHQPQPLQKQNSDNQAYGFNPQDYS
ncbi:UNKNOWN [Stylonychia lemnae]|uniref:Arrestin-like N-terminal domain-containing protein n=1 Tax=Stylonychia lemnae TaxID=5949 RepID=A0A078A1X9_STYLE|nr:UNKNOWN [Stylonychia lemnae]|eukprot:CDW76135.1 UNKNOWN [Stylonychia lemnae]